MVYRARDPVINRMVALKTITTGLADDPNLLQRFYREAQSAGGLQHPNIVTIYDMGDERGVPYIAMELIDGESLEQTISRRENTPLVLKVSYALQACRALDYAHKRGIVHRDVKPANVMVNKESVIKVVDFGIARILDASKTQTGMLIGTFAYMSPEQYNGEHADERSDIWSFGVLLYELLCYQRPFTGETPATVMNSICTQQQLSLRERNVECPLSLESVIAKLLQKSPEDRFQSMEDVLLELEPVYKELQSRSVEELVTQSSEMVEQRQFARARELLREALKIESANTQARALLDKVNTELKRLLIRPKAQQQVDKGRALLQHGRVKEALAEVENALRLDSNFEEARELEKQIQGELDRVRRVAEWLQTSRKRLAEGMLDEAEEFIAKVREIDGSNKQAQEIEQQVSAERTQRKRRLRFLEQMQIARGMWTQLNYDGCMEVLRELEKEFPGEEEIQRLAEAIREDQAEQQKLKTLERARNFLASGNYAESRAVLNDLQRRFPTDQDVPKLLEDIRLDEAKQHRLQRLSEAKSSLANRQYDDSIAILSALEKEYGPDEEISRLLEAARADHAEQQKQRQIRELRNLLAARRHDECLTLIAELQSKFPNDKETFELQKAVRDDQAQYRKQSSLATARGLLANRQWEESIRLLLKLEDEFSADPEVSELLQVARAGQAEQQRQNGMTEVRNMLAARRYNDCNELLAGLLEQFPADQELLEFQKIVLADQLEQQRLQGIAQTKNLLAAHRYSECDVLLSTLSEQFPNDVDIAQLRKALQEARSEQQKVEKLARARTLLAARNYEGAVALLFELEKKFPGDPDIGQLLQTAQTDQAEQRRRQGIADVRNVLAARRYRESTALLRKLQEQFPGDPEILQLQKTVEEEEAEQEKLQNIQQARNLLAKRSFDSCIALLREVGKKFPHDDELLRLETLAREGLSELRKLDNLKQVRSLLAARRYDESISLLTQLSKEFPDDREIVRLLTNAGREQAEQQKQQKIAEARALLAAQQFSAALQLLDTLHAAHPTDGTVQKLRAVVERERDKQNRSERLQRELEVLKKLVNENRYAELLTQAEPLRTDYATNTDLLRLIDFARSQQARIENEERLRTAINNARARLTARRFTEAITAVDSGLKAFPGNPELLLLRDDVEAQEKKQRVQGLIEQRIREIKFKINREEFSGAIDLAKQTIATVGPDTDLTHLLTSAAVELKARDKKRQQEQKLEEIRTLMESGNFDGAAGTLHDAVQTAALDAFDPRVSRISSEIDAAKSAPTIVSPTGTPAMPAGFSKEYAFQQGRPLLEAEPPTAPGEPTATSVQQASASQPAISSEPAVSLPPRSAEIAPRVIPNSEPALPFGSDGQVSTPAVRRQPAKAAIPAVFVAPSRDFRRAAIWGSLALIVVLGGWAAAHFVFSHRHAPVTLVTVQPNGNPAGPRNPATPGKSAQPAINAAELQQKNAIARSDQLVASGDLPAALLTLEGADKLSGPLTAKIKSRETTIAESMRNASLAKLRQQESTLWTRAIREVDQGEFDAAKRDLREVLSLGNGGIHKAEARNYLDVEIPRRQKEENLFREAQQSFQATDQQGLKRADDLLNQVIALNGPRKPQAEALQQSVESKLVGLKRADTNRQIATLEAAGRQNIQKGDLNGARQNASQIQQLGGNPAALLSEIDQALQQSVQKLTHANSGDHGDVAEPHSNLATSKGNGSPASNTVVGSNQKLETATSPQPAASPSRLPPSPSQDSASADLEKAAVRAALDQFNRAFRNGRSREVTAIWPTADKRYLGAMNPGGGYSFAMALTPIGDIEISEDQAVVPCDLVSTTTEPGGVTKQHHEEVSVTLHRTSGRWLIVNPLVKP